MTNLYIIITSWKDELNVIRRVLRAKIIVWGGCVRFLQYKVHFISLSWAVLYFMMGYVSLYMDTPVSRVSFVWFPSGVAVSAFLILSKRFWPEAFVLMFFARFVLDVTFRHTLETSITLSVISLLNDLSIAWIVKKYSNTGLQIRTVFIWLLATVSTSFIAGVLAGVWLVHRHDISFNNTLWIWWAANVVGTILVTSIIMGIRWESSVCSIKKLAVGTITFIAMIVCAWCVFSQPAELYSNKAIIFGLSFIPVTLLVLIPVLSANNIGALAFLIFCGIVIYNSFYYRGPFFIKGLVEGESLLLAQCYLTSIALLLIFIYVLKDEALQENSKERVFFGGKQSSYQLDCESGQILWNYEYDNDLNIKLNNIEDKEGFLSLLDEHEREKLVARWQFVLNNNISEDVLHLKLHLTGNEVVNIVEHRCLHLKSLKGSVIIGYFNATSNSKLNITLKHKG